MALLGSSELLLSSEAENKQRRRSQAVYSLTFLSRSRLLWHLWSWESSVLELKASSLATELHNARPSAPEEAKKPRTSSNAGVKEYTPGRFCLVLGSSGTSGAENPAFGSSGLTLSLQRHHSLASATQAEHQPNDSTSHQKSVNLRNLRAEKLSHHKFSGSCARFPGLKQEKSSSGMHLLTSGIS